MIRFLQSGNKAAKYLLGGMLLVLCGSMCLYLIPGFMNGSTINQSGVIASLDGQDITTQEVQQMAGVMLEQQRQRGQQVPDFYLPMIRQQAVQQLLQAAEIRYEGDRLGLRVSDQELQNYLRTGQFGEMFYPKGNFVGFEKYQELVRSFGVTPDEFERQIRLQLQWNKIMSTITAGIAVSPAEIEKAYKDQNTKAKFDYAVIKTEDVEKTIKPTDAELKAFYDANKSRYQNSIPEKRQVRYFIISDKDVENKVTVTPTDIDQYYRSHMDQYRMQETVDVRHILIETPKPGPDGKVDQKGVDAARAKAEDILKKIKAGGDFAALAKEYSEDPGTKEKGGQMDWFGRDANLDPTYVNAAFSLNKGQLSDLVYAPAFGFFIIQSEDKHPAHVKSLAEVKDSIEQVLKQQKLAAKLDQTGNAAETDARNDGLDKAAAKYSAQIISTNPITRTDVLPGVGAAPDLMSTIFTVDQKAGAQYVRIPQGDVIFQVEKIMPPRTPEFEEIKDRVTADFKSERASTLLTQKTSELADRAHSAHDLHKAAKELGATVKTSDLVGHSSQVPDVGSMSGSANVAFTLKEGEISGPLNTGRNGIVIQVIQHQEPALSGDEFAKAQDSIREELVGQKRQMALQLFMSNLNDRLEKEGKLKINKNEMANLGRGRS